MIKVSQRNDLHQPMCVVFPDFGLVSHCVSMFLPAMAPPHTQGVLRSVYDDVHVWVPRGRWTKQASVCSSLRSAPRLAEMCLSRGSFRRLLLFPSSQSVLNNAENKYRGSLKGALWSL